VDFLPMINGLELGPPPNLLAAEIVKLKVVDGGQLKKLGSSIEHPLSSSQEVNTNVELKELFSDTSALL
jgi:hypothetical protein